MKKIEVEIVKCEKRKMVCLGCFPMRKSAQRRIEVEIKQPKGK